MYENHQAAIGSFSAATRSRLRHVPTGTHRAHCQTQLRTIGSCFLAMVLVAGLPIAARAQQLQSASVVRKISELSEKLELTTNSSRILTLDKNIPRVQVNNPELLAVTPLSATQVQVSAKKAGVTQVNLWDEDGKIHAVDVLIYGDARELEVALQTQFPHASIKVFRYSESLVLTGYVDRPDHVSPIMLLAQDYAPKVINNIQVGGVQQVLLKVKVMEISRTKLRRMATDFSLLNTGGGFLSTGVSGLISNTDVSSGVQTVTDTAGKAAEFGIVHNNATFFGFLDWLQQNNLAKILSEPNIMAVSGRPAQFNVGGEIPIVVPQSLGTASIEFKPFGTQVDFLPIVLGNGSIRLEVRPRISEIDDSRSVIVQNFTIPALTVRQVDTAVEMKAGQTFALAGLVQERTKAQKRGLPYVQDMPVIGVPFRKVENETNEIELLIIVTPEFVDPIDACEMPCGGPGTYSTSPTNCGLYCAGHMEVPTACNPTQGLGSCGQDPCGNRCGGSSCGTCGSCNGAMPVMNGGMPTPVATPGPMMPGGAGYEMPTTVTDQVQPGAATTELPAPGKQDLQTVPQDIALPATTGGDQSATTTEQPKAVEQAKPAAESPVPLQQPAQPKPSDQPGGPTPGGTSYYQPIPNRAYNSPVYGPSVGPVYTTPRPYSPPRQPVFVRNASRPNNPQPLHSQQAAPQRENNLIGPVGYDIQQ